MLQTLLFIVSILAIIPMVSFAEALKKSTGEAKKSPEEERFFSAEPIAHKWVELLDKGHYQDAWNQSSSHLKSVMDKDGWISTMKLMRQVFGTPVAASRTIIDQRAAHNPKGLPAGEYAVMVYKTQCSIKKDAMEIVTLHYENGKWIVMTYQCS